MSLVHLSICFLFLLSKPAGTESLIEWIDDPSYPNTTLSWNIINGSINA